MTTATHVHRYVIEGTGAVQVGTCACGVVKEHQPFGEGRALWDADPGYRVVKSRAVCGDCGQRISYGASRCKRCYVAEARQGVKA